MTANEYGQSNLFTLTFIPLPNKLFIIQELKFSAVKLRNIVAE